MACSTHSGVTRTRALCTTVASGGKTSPMRPKPSIHVVARIPRARLGGRTGPGACVRNVSDPLLPQLMIHYVVDRTAEPTLLAECEDVPRQLGLL